MTETHSPLRRRLPTILAEAISVIFAVLFALAVDQWWQDRENVALAERTTDAIAQEIRGNREELSDAEDARPGAAMTVLDSAIASFRAGERPAEVSIDWNVALLSSSAWNAAQVSRATQYMELDQLIELARVYELQRLYAGSQDRLVSLIADIPSGIERAPVETLVSLRSHLALTLDLRSTLVTIYGCTLARVDGSAPPEPDECTETIGSRPRQGEPG